MPTSASTPELLRAQFKQRASSARLAWEKLTRKRPAALPPIKSLPKGG